MGIYFQKNQLVPLEINHAIFEAQKSMERVYTTFDTAKERLGKLNNLLEEII